MSFKALLGRNSGTVNWKESAGGEGRWLSIPAAWLASKEKQETKTFGPNSCLLDKVRGWLTAEAFAVMICPCLERLLLASGTPSQLCKLTFPNSLVHTCGQGWVGERKRDIQTPIMLIMRCSVHLTVSDWLLLSFQTQLTSLANVHHCYHYFHCCYHNKFENTCLFFILTTFSTVHTHSRKKNFIT